MICLLNLRQREDDMGQLEQTGRAPAVPQVVGNTSWHDCSGTVLCEHDTSHAETLAAAGCLTA